MGIGNRVGRWCGPCFRYRDAHTDRPGRAVAAAPGRQSAPVYGADVTPLAAVSPSPQDTSGVTVVALTKRPTNFRLPRPPSRRRAGDRGQFPWRHAQFRRSRWPPTATPIDHGQGRPGCGISWNLLAGIGRIESGHANGGATDAHGTAVNPDLRTRAGRHAARNEVIVQTVQAGHAEYARRWGRCSSCPAPGRATPPTATATAKRTRRTSTTRRWPRLATCAAAG